MNYLSLKGIRTKTYHKDIVTYLFNTQGTQGDFLITHQTKEEPTDQHKDLRYPILSISMHPIKVVENEYCDL